MAETETDLEDGVRGDVNVVDGNVVVDFHYLKSPAFRSVHVDGVFGGLGGNGNIRMAVFNERRALPRKIRHQLNEDGTLGDEIVRQTKNGFVRELEVDLVMSLHAARVVHGWLGEKLDEVERVQELLKKAQKANG